MHVETIFLLDEDEVTQYPSTSAIVQNLKSLVSGYDKRHHHWCDAIHEYDIFMCLTRPYWLEQVGNSYQKLLRSTDFLEEVRRVVGKFGMDSRASQLTGIGLFFDTIAEARYDFHVLFQNKVLLVTLNLKERIGDETVASVIGRIYNLFLQPKKLSLSGGTVVASKTMHMIMPELFIIVDSQIAIKLSRVLDYRPHLKDGKNWRVILPSWDGNKLNLYSSSNWKFSQNYLAALIYYKRIIHEWCEKNRAEISDFLELGKRAVLTDPFFRTRTEYKAASSRIIDMALW